MPCTMPFKVMGLNVLYASNAFNSVNRPTALHNIDVLCPSIANVLYTRLMFNVVTYTHPLRVQSKVILLQWQCTYAIAVRHLIDKLKTISPAVKQVWYANDATGAATGSELHT